MDSRIPFIKVCGIQTTQEAQGSIVAGANAIGLLLGLTHLAEDKVSADTGRAIVNAINGAARTVMVTHLLDEHAIADMAKFTGVSAIQVHDDLPADGMIALRRLMPKALLIKAVHVMDESAVEKAKEYAVVSDMLLMDSRTKDRLGGTGQTHDWNISRSIVDAVNIPVILAGGLTPANVEQAIAQVNPAGIDANSGLERSDGSKDFDKIRAFSKAGQMCQFKAVIS